MKITIQEIKNAMRDYKFRGSLPPELMEDVRKYESNPGCPCNLSIYKKVLKYGRKQLQEYYPGKEIIEYVDEKEELAKNNFSVTNCTINDLESKLRKLEPGSKQIVIARHEEDITLIINEKDTGVENNFSVVNCHVNELENKLRSLSPGQKQIALARYKNEATLIINELNFVF